MLTYQVLPPAGKGDFRIVYPTPGAPHVLTVAGTASSEQAAQEECERLNEAQVTEKREEQVREANAISDDLRAEEKKV